MGKSFFLKGVFYGALAGGALSLLDKTTRESVVANCKKATKEITYYVKNPGKAVSQIQDLSEKIQTTYEQVSSEVSFILEKVDELKDSTAEVVELVEDTKEAFFDNNEDEKSVTPIH